MSVNINTELKQKNHGPITLDDDLKSIYSFKNWIKNNLLIYKDIGADDVSYEHVLIYLSYIEMFIIEEGYSLGIDRSEWVKRLGKLIVKAKKAIRAGNDSE